MLIDIIREITQEKRAAHIVPEYALGRELRDRSGMSDAHLKAHAASLVQFGLIRTGRTLNDDYYQLIERETK